jgi:hypothetical protein
MCFSATNVSLLRSLEAGPVVVVYIHLVPLGPKTTDDPTRYSNLFDASSVNPLVIFIHDFGRTLFVILTQNCAG